MRISDLHLKKTYLFWDSIFYLSDYFINNDIDPFEINFKMRFMDKPKQGIKS